MAKNITRTTVALPTDLLERIDLIVQEGKARSRNTFVTAAVRRNLATLEASEIDAAFTQMAEDKDYQAVADRLSEEFAAADWQAFQLAESRIRSSPLSQE